jgi:hypothetical protein
LSPGHPLTRDEVFLPFVTVERVPTSTPPSLRRTAAPYGLTAGVFSRDEEELDRFLDEIEAGVVYVNRRAGGDDRRVVRDPVLLRLEVERPDRQGRPRPVITSNSSHASRAGQSWRSNGFPQTADFPFRAP